ncbi:wbl [Bugula neritina]|uniref:Wbl n=1 Tax=Bugula neritina TaxID=10212 RepID=A0A7J7J761_BUGNE|nr:wbl [Bugula neritina]
MLLVAAIGNKLVKFMVVSNQNVTVVLFMHYLASGVVNTEFKNFAESTGTQPEVIAATVPLLDGGHQENWEIAQRFNLSMDRLPVIKVFVRGKEVAHMEEVTNCDDIRQLVREHTGLWIGRPGTLQYLDELVNEFMKTGQEKRREEIIELARQFRDDESISDEHFKSATYYIEIKHCILLIEKMSNVYT